MTYNLGTRNAPSPKVIIPFFALSACSWVVVTLLLLFHPQEILKGINHSGFFHSIWLTLTHILVLGFMTSVIFGALFQLLPVIFIRKIYSEKLALYVFLTLFMGVVGLAISFYVGINGTWLTIFGIILNSSILLFILNVWATIGESTENAVAKLYVKTSVVWLALTTLVGLSLAINFWVPYLPFNHLELLEIHAHIGVFGWFLFLVIGVSSVLIPMFLLVHKLNKDDLYYAYYAILLGMIFGIIAKSFRYNILMYISFGLVIVGLLLYLKFMRQVYIHRMRKRLDFELKKSIIALPSILIVIVSGVIAITGIGVNKDFNFSAFYIIAFLLGFVTTLILGQFYKTLPFIMWLKIYKPFVGKEKTLLPKDLHSAPILKLQYYFHIIGFTLFLSSLLLNNIILFYLGGILMCGGAILFAINVTKVITHKRKIFN